LAVRGRQRAGLSVDPALPAAIGLLRTFEAKG
jgi:hypothetical protein